MLIFKHLKKHENMFYGTLANYAGIGYKVELLEGAQSHQPKTFPIPKMYEETLK